MPNEEGGLHPTTRMTAMRELAIRLCSTSISDASEASSSNKEGTNDISDGPNDGLMHHHVTITMEGMTQPLKDKFQIWQNYFSSADQINLYFIQIIVRENS